jgi:glycosyltransferase involved in cell wall biosynthesis
MVAEAVASVRAQQPALPAEIVVVDDGSVDGTADAARDAGATVIRHERSKGVGAARNTGIAHTSQPWLAFLDSDDTWSPDLLDRLWARRHGRVFVSGSLRTSVSGRVKGNPTARPLELLSPAAVLDPENVVVAGAVLVERAAVLAAGGFPESSRCEDLELWIALLERGSGLVLPGHGGVYREHSGQIVSDTRGMQSAVRDMLGRLAGRPWLTPAVVDYVEVTTRWDNLRDGTSGGGPAATARLAVWLAARPRRLAMLARLWRWRWRTRHPQLVADDGEASDKSRHFRSRFV